MSDVRDLASEIADANEAFAEAFERRDAEALARLHTGGGSLLPEHRGAVEGRPAIEAYWRAVLEGGARRLRLEPVEVDRIGESAYEVGRYALEGEDGALDEGKMLALWKREGGSWKLHRAIWNTAHGAQRS